MHTPSCHRANSRQRVLRLFDGMLFIGAMSSVIAKDLVDYFVPTPIVGKMTSDVWGDKAVLPRDPSNGLEGKTSTDGKKTLTDYAYWDGKIIKGPEGKYHLFCSRWDQSGGHQGYYGSVAIHAVSDNLLGPYIDKGICYPDNEGGKGHNVTAIALKDGRYGILVSDTRPGALFLSNSLDGPWVYQGNIKWDNNGHTTRRLTDNMSILERPDGKFMIVPLGGFVGISDNGINGTYKVMTDDIFPMNVPGYGSCREDPNLWYSGGQYHVVVDDYCNRKALHLTSPDGINNWKYTGAAYASAIDFVRFTDGTTLTSNRWYKMERANTYEENGHVVAFTFAAIDVDKGGDKGNDTHGSKIIVVPFDGAKFDADIGIPSSISPAMQSGTARGISFTVKCPMVKARKTFFIPAEAAHGAEQISVSVYDLKGRLVAYENNGTATGKNQEIAVDLDRSKAGPGVYCITMRCGKQNYSGRLTIQ